MRSRSISAQSSYQPGKRSSASAKDDEIERSHADGVPSDYPRCPLVHDMKIDKRFCTQQ